MTVSREWATIRSREADAVPVKDPGVFKVVEKMGDHFQTNISNRFIRKALPMLDLRQSEWDRLENLTNELENYKIRGFEFDELYETVLAAAHFIFQARARMVPNIRTILAAGAGDSERVLRDMAAQNFPLNLSIFSDQVNELYMKTANLDRQAHSKSKPVYERIPELKDIGRMLVGG